MADKKTSEPLFTMEQLKAAKKFADDVDIVSAVLEDGKTYTIEEAQKKVTDYKKGKVN